MVLATYQGKRVLVIGLGLSGRSAANFLLKLGAEVHGVDRNATMLETHPDLLAIKQEGLKIKLDHEMNDLAGFDLVVLSPGISTSHPLAVKALQMGIELIGEIELGCRAAHHSMIGITGTNGKTTVTLLITHVLNQSGLLAKALGNVGVPFTQEILTLKPEEIAVLELSSYQLETLQQKILDEALILNVTPDHLDRYGTMQKYAEAKFGIERSMKNGGSLFVERETKEAYGHLLEGQLVSSYGYTADCTVYTDLECVFLNGQAMFTLPPALRGKQSHDVENLLAAYAVCSRRGISAQQFLQAYATFKKPSHRIEFVLERDGVRYYDDSKGTNIDAVMRAVQSLDGMIILIAGGVDKGASYTPWIQLFKDRVKLICAIGQAADKIKGQLSHQIPVHISTTLDLAIQHAAGLAKKGEIVLLSPGCASFDMFRDYVHRGEEFQRLVRQL
ncbi:UDP-N-acetylmuramoylalanine--D-glutamate ligase [Candidatus Protochlamydia naegleriophila]|uniref:UDP-N-acetylmuramoylalanine--D-glutamate ligase n=1 Tax=Candidatus Protochlamydia naegleriophila TaxID=389348 RepID=A0A0U5JEC8_9BACT|nr:UDP-N-acetylmuramoyl-L-alanine--D-glutamate ligase [Candidatus Protochlamydia naegleriophila]CUI16245.1 UDP-N-acetylmuramoylalanine--D-glutamate ligase [Candidatus Protochlamydia naegleriophila]